MQKTLSQSLFQTLFIGIVIASLLIVGAVWRSASTLVVQNIDHDVSLAEKVFDKVVADRQAVILSVSKVLSRSFDFRRAVGTENIPSIEAAFRSYAERLNTDIIALVSLDHKVVASHSPLFEVGQSLKSSVALVVNQKESGLFVVNDYLVQLSLIRVEIPTLRYYMLIGVEFDDALLQELKQLVDAEIIISKTETNEILTTTLSTSEAQRVLALKRDPSWVDVTFNDELTYFTRRVNIGATDRLPVNITLAVDTTSAFNAFSRIQITILVFCLGAMIIALAFSLVLAKNVTKPVSNLVKAVNRVASGSYGSTLDEPSKLREITELANAVDSMQANIKSRELDIRYQAEHDVLTGLFNRNYVENYFESEINKERALQVVAITVIGFRTINDLYGYSNGDNTLKALAQRLQRWPGISARLAGGEVLYISHESLNDEQLETLKHILEQPVESNLIAIPLKVAMAVLECPQDAFTSEELFRKMNIVTDEAIHSDKWCVRYRAELEDKYNRRLSITTELKRALASQQNELSMVYQPKIDLVTMKVCSMEALIRWNSSVLGFVPPDEFITIAEQAGLIEQVTSWVMKQTISDLAYFRERGYDFTVAMNLSTQDIQNKVLLSNLVSLLNEKGLSPDALELEITESDLVADASLAIENLNELTARGFHFAIDDFGTGYSSLAYLKNLPVKTIKIDKSFILSLASDENDQQIVHTVLSLAAVFNLKVVAEGVEDLASLNILKDWGCDVAQGYYISRPLKLADLEEWLQNTPFGE
ncbi:putative bifunctional diguanylate cyclase/phosphodiesterase [Alteromonas marina]|uniref:putative bifunctional diguanylate cyclase/phosphodiesterase n=1 Tax=unclassified Alteromonas TaxID=2614992 RepID=UPI0012E4554F|nr:GGDEF domain-containing phosphodiesterase [Alteromonas sp. KUL150]GFD70865.1 phosphodiesterase [Tenacibaculum sp. KUL113]GFD84287.1 phosphodiesterase [Alteromonas sp. KUL150]